jgi:hypothetical protein
MAFHYSTTSSTTPILPPSYDGMKYIVDIYKGFTRDTRYFLSSGTIKSSHMPYLLYWENSRILKILRDRVLTLWIGIHRSGTRTFKTKSRKLGFRQCDTYRIHGCFLLVCETTYVPGLGCPDLFGIYYMSGLGFSLLILRDFLPGLLARNSFFFLGLCDRTGCPNIGQRI